MIIVDTSVWIDYLRGTENPHTAWIERNLDVQPLALIDLILCEVLQGYESDALFAHVQRRMEDFTILQTGGVAVASAQNYRILSTKGYTIRKTIDCPIATVCLLGDHTLLHRDRDFDPFEQHLGLNVIHPDHPP